MQKSRYVLIMIQYKQTEGNVAYLSKFRLSEQLIQVVKVNGVLEEAVEVDRY